MRITIDYTAAVRQGAGIGRYTRQLVRSLAALDRENEYTLFVAGGDAVGGDWPSNFRFRTTRIPSRALAIAWHRLQLPVAMETVAGPADLVLSPDFTLPPLRSARGIVTVHDLSFIRLPECADPGLKRYLDRAVPESVRRAARVLADSDSTRQDLMECFALPDEKISVVPGGVDERFVPVYDPAARERVAQRYGLPPWYVLSVGTQEPRKNYVRLIRAFAQMIRQTALPHELVIAGRPGWLYDEIPATIKEEGLEDKVHLIGFVDDADLPILYSAADLFVFASLYEGFGLPPLEAMACGTAVVAANNSSLPEAVGSAAVLVDALDVEQITDAMARVLGNASLRARLTDLGRAQAQRFTWERSARLLLQVFDEVGAGDAS